MESANDTVEKENEKGARLSLLGLPAEIRNLIWEHTFPAPAARSSSVDSSTVEAETISRSSASGAHERSGKAASYPNLDLLLTCKKVRAETQLLAFARTAFRTRLCRPSALTHRLAVLSPAQIRAIRSLTFTSTSARAAQQWEGDLRPLLFPVYVQCRKLLWEAVRLLPGVRFVDYVLAEDDGGAGGAGKVGGRGRTVGGAKFFFDTVVGVGWRERSGRGETHAWDESWAVLPGGEGEERCVWLVEEAAEERGGGGETQRRVEKGSKRWVRVEIVRLPLGG